MKNQVNETLSYINSRIKSKPEIAIILGTGLSGLVNEISIETEIPYSDIPNFPVSTVESHQGKLIVGSLSGKNIIAMSGRFHYYEGYSMQEITFPIRVMRQLGANILIITNAAGSLNPEFKKGDIMLLTDYINLLGTTPLIGEWDESMGPRFPDMIEPYSNKLSKLANEICASLSYPLRNGVYSAMPGSCLESRAEYKMLRLIGADAIGMSTVPETIVAKQVGFETIGLSILTDECWPEGLKPTTLNDIIEAANNAEPYLSKIIVELIKNL